MSALIDSAAYVPHGYCLFWQPWLVALFAGSDLLIFASYSAIPLALLIFLRRRPDIRFRGLVALFASFIMLCGLAHLISIVTLWEPVYPLHGAVKLLTGIVSAVTAVVLFILIPRLVAIPSPRQLEVAHARLTAEIAAHRETLARLQETEREIEGRIERRTADLAEANRQLSVMSREAVHRGANLAAVIMSLARETARRVPDLATFMERFSGRVAALAGATASLTARATGAYSLLGDVVRGQREPVLETYGERLAIVGPDVEIDAKAAQHMALAVHELATNAVKYGALSVPQGRVEVSWTPQDGGRELVFAWREAGVIPIPRTGTGGFGTRLLTIAVPGALEGVATRTFGPDGLVYELRFPLPEVITEHRSPAAVPPPEPA